MGEKETAGAADAERSVIKTKTKSNQSNDRQDAEDGGDLDNDGGLIADDSDPAATPVLKNKTKSNQSNDVDQDFRVDASDAANPPPEAAINTSHSNIKNLREGGITHEDDWHDNAAKLAPERPVKSEIAIGDPGVNGNLAVNDPGVGAATPKKSN